jgi:hypothetical protein
MQEGGIDVVAPLKARHVVDRSLRWRCSRGVSSEIVAPAGRDSCLIRICGGRIGACGFVDVVFCGAHRLIFFRRRAIIGLRPIAFIVAAELLSK